MNEWVIYHNNKCSKSRGTLELLKENGITPYVVSYLETPPSEKELKDIIRKLKLPPASLVRTKEDSFKKSEVDLKDLDSVVKLLAKNPTLIERPIVVRGERAVIGRPPENVLDLLK